MRVGLLKCPSPVFYGSSLSPDRTRDKQEVTFKKILKATVLMCCLGSFLKVSRTFELSYPIPILLIDPSAWLVRLPN